MIILRKKPVYHKGHKMYFNSYDRFFRGKWDCSNPIMDYATNVNKDELLDLYHRGHLQGEVSEYVETILLK